MQRPRSETDTRLRHRNHFDLLDAAQLQVVIQPGWVGDGCAIQINSRRKAARAHTRADLSELDANGGSKGALRSTDADRWDLRSQQVGQAHAAVFCARDLLSRNETMTEAFAPALTLRHGQRFHGE